MKLRAKTDLRYAGRNLKAGETFDALTEADADILRRTGKAEDVLTEKRRYNRRDMRAKH